MTLFWVFIGIAGVFYIATMLKGRFNLKVCSICLAVSVSWAILLTLRALGFIEDDLLIALLMGESVVGGYYLFERKARPEWLVFRLPVILSLSYIAFTVVADKLFVWAGIVVLSIWLLHGALFYYRNHPSIKDRVDTLIACCSKW